jgi:hypothetical protein
MLHWKQLARESDDQLAAHDIAAVNLACAEGLPAPLTMAEADVCIRWLDLRAHQVAATPRRACPGSAPTRALYATACGTGFRASGLRG